MNLNPLPWLRGGLVRSELAKWTAAGTIQPEQAQRIADQYDRECCGLDVAQSAKLTFFALSAISMLLALVLVVADHWREIYLPMKVAVPLIGMAVAHSCGYWYRFHVGQERRGDSAFALGTIFYGCVMLLAVDHYYAGSPYWSAAMGWVFFAWAAGAFPLAWVLGASSLLALSVVLGVIWVVWHVFAAGTAGTTALFVALALSLLLCLLRVLGWSYFNTSRGLFALTVVSILIWWCVVADAEGWGRGRFYWYAALGPLLILIGLRHDETHPFAATFRSLGLVWSAIMLLALTMPSVSRELMDSGQILRLLLAVTAGLGLVVVFLPGPRRLDYARAWPAIAGLVSVTLLPALLGVVADTPGFTTAATIALAALFNVAALAVVVSLVWYGVVTDCGGCVLAGIAYFTLWLALVTIDMVRSLTAAALIFAVASPVLLIVARLQSRKEVAFHEAVSAESA